MTMHAKPHRTKLGGASLATLVTAAGLLVGAAPALAAQASNEPTATESTIGEIVVTARKRAEDILKTPVTVKALTSEDLALRGVVSINNVADFTPGVNINNNSAGRNDRSFQQIIVRGFTPSTVLATTTSTFIDGVPVSSPSAFTSISDPARIEILKGPQSAYFGRNTFAGAVNVVNKLPAGEWGGDAMGMVGTRDNYRVRGSVEGPLIGDLLTFRLGVDKFSKSGSYKNAFNRSETLGDQSTTSGNLLIVAKPIDGLTIKAFGLLSKDDDGAPANGFISAYTIRDPSGNIITQGQSNCTVNNNPTFCGTTPKLLATSPSANTTNDSFIQNLLANPSGRLISPKDGVQGYGLLRRYQHAHLTIDYDLGDTGVTLSSLTGYNHEAYSQFSDVDNVGTTASPNNGFGSYTPGARTYFDFPYLIERVAKDFSQEVRAAYDRHGKLRATVGASYLNATDQNDSAGGNGALGTTVLAGIGGKNRSRTVGAFFGVTYDVIEDLTVSVEGRYQVDKLYAYAPPTGLTNASGAFVPAGVYPGNSVIVKDTFKNFLPRVIVNYNLTSDLMAYGSVAKGVNPGSFNAGILNQNASTQQAAANAGLHITVDPEKVTNYELGLKGKALDNRLRFSIAGYFSQWRDQINNILLSSVDPVTQTAVIVSGSANTGSVDIKGLEGEFRWTANDFLTLDGGGAITDSKVKSFQGPAITSLTGISDFSGKQQPNVSKYSANLGAQIGSALSNLEDAAWFMRVDYIYKSGLYANQANIVKTPDINKVNARIGVTRGRTSLEAFANNVFNNKSYTSIADNWIITNNFRYLSTNSALVVGLPELRTIGVQLKVGF